MARYVSLLYNFRLKKKRQMKWMIRVRSCTIGLKKRLRRFEESNEINGDLLQAENSRGCNYHRYINIETTSVQLIKILKPYDMKKKEKKKKKKKVHSP